MRSQEHREKNQRKKERKKRVRDASEPAPAESEEAPAPKKRKKATSSEKMEESSKGDEKLAKMTKAAVADIIKLIEKDVKGGSTCPADWHLKYKPVLGPFKLFVKAQTDTLAFVEKGYGDFIVYKADDSRAPAVTEEETVTWKRLAIKAWNAYCKATPAAERSVTDFNAALPSTKEEKKERKQKPKQKTDVSPKLNGKASPAMSETKTSTKKKKKHKQLEAR